MKVLVVKDIEREDIEFITKVSTIKDILCNVYIVNNYHQTIGCRPIASLDHFLPEHLGQVDLVEEVAMGTGKVVKVECINCVIVCSLVWGWGVGDRSTGCNRTFSHPCSKGL